MSKIEWCDKTWNVITGCSGISEACTNCYARTMHKRLHAMQKTKPSLATRKYAEPFDEVIFHEDMLNEILDTRKYPSGSKIFVNSMSDTFHDEMVFENVKKIFKTIKHRPDCDFLFLTKRARNMCAALEYSNTFGYLGSDKDVDTKNALFGATIENQDTLNERLKWLLRIKSEVGEHIRVFLSCEPLLSELDFGEDLKHIDWVIVGGEKVPNAPKKARPMQKEWVEKLYNDCKSAGVPFFFKQWGNAPRENKEPCEFETCKEFYKGGEK